MYLPVKDKKAKNMLKRKKYNKKRRVTYRGVNI